MNVDLHAYNIFDLRDIALKRVPRGLFEFMDRGTEDEVSLKNNRAVFDRLRFRTRTMVDVFRRNQDAVIFGVKRKMPLRDRATCRCFRSRRMWPRSSWTRRRRLRTRHGWNKRCARSPTSLKSGTCGFVISRSVARIHSTAPSSSRRRAR
jgi:hypothetical protein